jgi:hypothetical protein
MADTKAQKQLAEICTTFNVKDVYELSELHLKHDQQSIHSENTNITDPSLVQNKIKDALLLINLSKLPVDERRVVQNTLWLWYHHAATIAVWKKHDILLARHYCDTALEYLYPEHPNKITPMLCMLLHGNEKTASQWAREKVGPVEQAYADYLLAEYERGTFNMSPPPITHEGRRE